MDPTVLARVEVGKENAHERSPPASLGQADGRGGEGEGGKSERRKTSVTMIIGWWREIERVKAWCRGSPELSSGLVLYWKESQDPEKLLCTRLWFITAKGYRLRSAKDKGDPAQSFQ